MALAAAAAVMLTPTAVAQQRLGSSPSSSSSTGGGAGNDDSGKGNKKEYFKPGNCWTISDPLGIRQPAEMDTLLYNYQRDFIPSMHTDAYATTGNTGAAGQTMIFYDRPQRQTFIFRDAIQRWIPSFDRQKFYNVYIPMTLLSYNFCGSGATKTDNLRAEFAGNVNRRLGFGGDIGLLLARGVYAAQAAKNFRFGLTAYYTGDRYEMQAFFNRFTLTYKENGGITNELYITDPAQLQGGVSSITPSSIPTRLTAAHSNANGSEFYMNHAFNVGFWKEELVNDTTKRDVYVPVMKFLYSLDYRLDNHLFTNTNRSQAAEFWDNTFYLNPNTTNDSTRFWNLSNTLGVQMIEGFQKWAKFGLAAFATYEYQRFRLPNSFSKYKYEVAEGETSPLTPLPEGLAVRGRESQHALWLGGEISKRKGSILTYDARARFGMAGYVLGDIEADGGIRTRIPLFKDTVQVAANARFLNKEQPFLLQNYISNHLAWSNDFGKTRTLRVGGELIIPWTRTKLEAGFENIQNYVYFDAASLPRQYDGNIQVFTARLTQKIKAGIWNWDNTVTYQACSDRDILPMPTLAVYSNMYLNFKAFKALWVQFGIDCDYYTRYRGVSYQPATMMFTLNDGPEVGNYPLFNAYLTCKLYKVRFYVLASHVTQGLFGKNYFSMPYYPIDPLRFRFGLSIDFAN